jgi:uncharacterized membrane protein YhaH (DUF805 family)
MAHEASASDNSTYLLSSGRLLSMVSAAGLVIAMLGLILLSAASSEVAVFLSISSALILQIGCITMYVGSLETRDRSLSSLLFKFEGRITRLDYWIVFLVANPVIAILVLSSAESPVISFANLLILICLPLITWIHLAVQVKRWHDRDKSGWMVLINLIPIVGLIWPIVELGFMPGSARANQYGPSRASHRSSRLAKSQLVFRTNALVSTQPRKTLK